MFKIFKVFKNFRIFKNFQILIKLKKCKKIRNKKKNCKKFRISLKIKIFDPDPLLFFCMSEFLFWNRCNVFGHNFKFIWGSYFIEGLFVGNSN